MNKTSNYKFSDKRALSISEAAKYACVSKRGTIENWISQGLLPFEELAGRGGGNQKFRRIRLDDLNTFLESHYCSTSRVGRSGVKKDLMLLPRSNK
jgi:excisionase family DNA binding protein